MSEADKKPDMCGSDRRPTTPGDDTNQPQLSADTRTYLAWLRTRMALESTLAAWVRTATSLIGFGFAIVQFFTFNQAQQIVRPKALHLAPYIGLALIAIGTLTTGIAIHGYRTVVKYLDDQDPRHIPQIPGMRRIYPDPILGVAAFVCLIGLLAFFAILAGEDLPGLGKP